MLLLCIACLYFYASIQFDLCLQIKILWEKTVIVINSTNKKNEQSPLILTELTKHKTDHDIGPGFGQAQKYGGIKSLNIIPTLHS